MKGFVEGTDFTSQAPPSFSFNITTNIHFRKGQVELPQNEDIQRSFIGRGYEQVMSTVRPGSRFSLGECHIYSLPYTFPYFELNNSFLGGVFDKVRYLAMVDTRSSEHHLFQLISQDFPFLEYLDIDNQA